jgi:hypothetical protein
VRPLRTAPEPARRPRWAVPVGVGALLLALAGGAVALNERDDGRTTAGADQPSADPVTSPRPSPAAATSAPAAEPSPQPSVEPSPVEPSPAAPESPAAESPAAEPGSDLPEGWTTDDGNGWTVALPPGFAQTRAGEYRDAGTGRTLRVETGAGQPDAVADRERAAAGFARRHPTYRQVRLEAVDYRGYEAADWEFTYEGLHVVNRVFVVDGTGHSLWLQTRADDGASARADLEAIAAAFTPA